MSQLYTFYSVLNRLFTKTLTPRDGNTSDITLFAKNLLARMRDGVTAFSVADFVWEEIKLTSIDPQKSCGFAPYIMLMIEEVTRYNFPIEQPPHHKALKPKAIKNPVLIMPTPPPSPHME